MGDASGMPGRERERETERERQTDRQADRQTGRQADRQTGRRTEGNVYIFLRKPSRNEPACKS